MYDEAKAEKIPFESVTSEVLAAAPAAAPPPASP
jgi:hypothetical protein